MTRTTGRADDRIKAWTAATDRPIPSFARRAAPRRGRLRAVWLTLAVAVLVGVVVGAVVVGGRSAPAETASAAELATGAASAFATAPGIDYRMSIRVLSDGGGTQGLDSTGTVDYTTGRFGGTADGGDGGSMLLFGGPTHGAVIVADGRFVKTEDGPWEKVADDAHPFVRLLDRAIVSTGLMRALGGATVDPAVGTIACGSKTCQTVEATLSPDGYAALAGSILGEYASLVPTDLAPIAVTLHVDPDDGFLRHLEAHATAGTTTTNVTLDLTRLDPPPRIDRPIP